MVQRKTTPITREGSRGMANNGGKGRGTGGSSLARASALSQNSSSRQQSQGKGGSRDQTTEITGPTDNINRGGRKGVDTSNKPSTQKAAEVFRVRVDTSINTVNKAVTTIPLDKVNNHFSHRIIYKL